MLTCMKPRLVRLQKSTNESAWGTAVVLGAAGPGLTSTSQEEQRRSRIRVCLKAIKNVCLVHWGQRIKEQFSGRGRIDSGHKVQTLVWWGVGTVEVNPGIL